MEDFNDDDDEDLSEAKLIYDDFYSDILKIDEYSSFKNMILYFK